MNIQSYLPSKKIQIVLGIIFVFAITVLVYFLEKRDSQKTLEEKSFIDVSLVFNNEDNQQYIDSDNDGVYDWEEDLWPELDPNNPDSDEDGILDGKYLKTKRAIAERERRGTDISESNLSETQKLGRSVFTTLLTLKQSGSNIDEKIEEKISDNIVSYIRDLTFGEKVYTRDQFSLVSNTKDYVYSYRNKMKDLFNKYPIKTSEIELLIEAIKNPADYQGSLRSVTQKYNKYLEALVVLEVPYVIAGRHTELTNNVSQIGGALENLTQEEVDDLISFSALIQIEKILNQTVNAIIKINNFFDIVNDPSIFEE